jgi:hypothetical protein
MASTDDLVFGHGHDAALNVAATEVGTPMFHDDVLTTLAALMALDDHYGLTQPDDCMFIAPGYAVWVMGGIDVLDPDIADRLAQLAECSEDDPRLAELDAIIASRPFEVTVVLEYDPPPFMAGRVFRIRVMNDAQAKQLPAMLTVRADGTPIELPVGGRVANVNDL